jgi:cyanophycinase
MKLPASLLFASAVIFCGANKLTAADFDYYLTGNAADTKPAQTEGALLLMGGGGLVEDAFRWFIKKAGGGDIVVLKATDHEESVADTFGTYLHGTIGGCDSVEVIAFHNRQAASDPKVLQALQKADGIFLGGGKQHVYMNYWKGTPVGDALNAHVRAGKPLGGSSAGLAVLGQIVYTAHVTSRFTSELAMKNPFDKALTLEPDFLHLDLMRGVITDTHFNPRGRLGRLMTFMSRITSDFKVDNLLGIGVDEKAALCVEANGEAHVFATVPEAHAWFVLPQQAPEVLEAGKPLTYRNVRVISASPDSSVNVLKRTITHPASDTMRSIVEGKLLPEG